MDIRDRPTTPRSPWQNGHAERLIGSIRRECLDHVIVFGKQHLRRLLRSYQQYYNGTRTHLSLGKDSPLPRAVHATGSILPLPIRRIASPLCPDLICDMDNNPSLLTSLFRVPKPGAARHT
jgi:integrase-like protein